MQLFADVIKMLIKEIISLKGTDKFLFKLAPYIVVAASVTMFACLPWGRGLQIIDYNIGIFFILAVSSLGVLGILLAGWASNNKYSLVGAMRSGAQMISYEISLGLSLMTIVVLSGTMNINELVWQQDKCWFIFQGHIPAIIAFVLYLIAATAETNRGPFDLPEAEHELTAGFHTEYSGISFGMFYLSEYLNLFIVSGIASLMFLGGWMPLHIRMGRLQCFHELDSQHCLVPRQGIPDLLHHHLVQVDLPPCQNRPASGFRMEIHDALLPGHTDPYGHLRGFRMGVLTD